MKFLSRLGRWLEWELFTPSEGKKKEEAREFKKTRNILLGGAVALAVAAWIAYGFVATGWKTVPMQAPVVQPATIPFVHLEDAYAPSGIDLAQAWVTARQMAEHHMWDASTAKWPFSQRSVIYSGWGYADFEKKICVYTFEVRATVHAQNAFGGTVINVMTCVAQRQEHEDGTITWGAGRLVWE